MIREENKKIINYLGANGRISSYVVTNVEPHIAAPLTLYFNKIKHNNKHKQTQTNQSNK